MGVPPRVNQVRRPILVKLVQKGRLRRRISGFWASKRAPISMDDLMSFMCHTIGQHEGQLQVCEPKGG